MSVQATTDTLSLYWSFTIPRRHTSSHTKQSISHMLDFLSAKSLKSAPFIHILQITFSIFCAALYELEREPAYWDAQARATLDAALKLRPRDHQAKNLILFLGDGKSCCRSGIFNTDLVLVEV